MNAPLACAGKDVLVTGAGGSIGSALINTIAASAPRSITLLDLSEHNIFALKRVLDKHFPSINYRAVIGSVTDSVLIDSLLSKSPKQVVFDAAAFKHVELMKLNPFAALMNTAVGTFTLAQPAVTHGCETLVRLAELITISLSRPETPMNVVPLCNISGSGGSVIPIFQQLANGKALTIMDPNATRCFMSLDEAVSAILEARNCRLNGYILIPRFPPPVRIADLATSLVNGRGSHPLEVIGLRPGEKLTEDFVGPKDYVPGDLMLREARGQRAV